MKSIQSARQLYAFHLSMSNFHFPSSFLLTYFDLEKIFFSLSMTKVTTKCFKQSNITKRWIWPYKKISKSGQAKCTWQWRSNNILEKLFFAKTTKFSYTNVINEKIFKYLKRLKLKNLTFQKYKENRLNDGIVC